MVKDFFCKVLKGKQVRFLYSTRCCKPHPFSEQKRHCRKMGRHSERGKSEDLPFGVLLTASGNRQFVTLGNSTVPKPFSEAYYSLLNAEVMHFKQLSQRICRQALLLCLTALTFLFISCDPKPGPTPPPVPVDAHAKGLFILNEGLFLMNNSTLSFYDFQNSTLTDDLFIQANQRGLGDVGNDLQQYGSKLYAVINNSNRVEIMRADDAKSLRSIDLSGKQPRNICFYGGKAFVSCYDGDIVRIDTSSLETDGTLHSGPNPDGICCCNGKLYVANSGGLNYPTYNNTVSVIDPASFTLLRTITVGTNPCAVINYNDQYVYVATRGNYDDVPYNLYKIDAATDQVVKTYNKEIYNLTIHGDIAYIYNYDFSFSNSSISVMDLKTDEIIRENFITDGTIIQTPYGITVNKLNGDVYIADAHDFATTGDIYCFSSDGKKKFSFEAGYNPGKMVFV